MKRALLFLAAALALQLAMLDGFAALWENAYGEPRSIDEALEVPLNGLALVVGGPLSMLLVALALYRALRVLRSLPVRLLFALAAWPSVLTAATASHLGACLLGIW